MKEAKEIPFSHTNQNLILDVSNVKTPISLKVDQVTDYGALTFTLAITIIASAITAFVTVYLVTKSNRDLISNQNQLQEQLLANQVEQQKNEVKSKNRQEWINEVRNLISSFLGAVNLIPIHSLDMINSTILVKAQEITEEKFLKTNENHRKLYDELTILEIKINLTLSKDNELDRDISALAYAIIIEFGNLIQKYDNILEKHGYSRQPIDAKTFLKNQEFLRIKTFSDTITEKTKTLLKNEWIRVKDFN